MKLETIRIYNRLQEALLARSYLEGKRIQVVIPDGTSVFSVRRTYASGVRLQVFEDAEQAEAMLLRPGCNRGVERLSPNRAETKKPAQSRGLFQYQSGLDYAPTW